MDESYFQSGIAGDSRFLPGERIRCRWVAADALREIAKDEEKSMAARIRHAARSVETGGRISKKVISSIGQRRFDKAFAAFKRICAEKVKNEA